MESPITKIRAEIWNCWITKIPNKHRINEARNFVVIYAETTTLPNKVQK